jgi:hypothetical protein
MSGASGFDSPRMDGRKEATTQGRTDMGRSLPECEGGAIAVASPAVDLQAQVAETEDFIHGEEDRREDDMWDPPVILC